MDTNIKAIADGIVNGVKSKLGDAWQSTLSEADRQLIADVAADAADLAVRAAGADAGDQLSLQSEQLQISAQLANIAAAESVNVVQTFWSTTEFVLGKAVAVATTALIAL